MENPSGNGSDQPGYDGGSLVTEHTSGVSTDWTPDEQLILEDGLSQYASESNIVRYAKIAVQLQNKTVRDVALRCRWMFKRDIAKRRKDDHLLTRKGKERKERMNELLASTSYIANPTGLSSYSQRVVANGKSNAIQYNVLVSPAGQLIKESAQALERVSTNLERNQVHENIGLLCQVRKNIRDILNNSSDNPGKLKQMPPLPVKLNEALLNSLIRHATLHQQMQ
ncbi:putative transcription factor MYB-HB-like family [Helianthus annuus]|nr:putative transcription factor MYB-HB-like family [Helianthus annuus]KAJ0945640.1 putative transcription factor MYB-HB-like family [Helianthus annuus]